MIKCVSETCDYFASYGECSSVCEKQGVKKNITNADRIRGMSDEELADMITGDREWLCEIMCGKAIICGGNCKEKALDWLQQPAETEVTE